MADGLSAQGQSLAASLVGLWAKQGRDGFLLSNPDEVDIRARELVDPECGVAYRFLWMPHRELRGNVAELQRRGILNPNRDETKLFRDPRDPNGRHCFLCPDNIAECHPLEALVPMDLAGRAYLAGANFAWIEPDHFTVMAAEHVDQAYARHVLEAMLELHRRTNGRFRVLFNGCGAGATIPWHLHYQITTARLPIERLEPDKEAGYPTAVSRFMVAEDGLDRAHGMIQRWIDTDAENHSINVVVTTIDGQETLFAFPRDQRFASAEGKGLVGGFEVAGDFVLSAPAEEGTFKNGTVATARQILSQISPPAWSG